MTVSSYVFYWKPGEGENSPGKVTFCKGGPIVCSGSGATEELDYASGNTIFKAAYEIPIEQDGYIFAASDLSYFRTVDEGVQQNVGTLAGLGIQGGVEDLFCLLVDEPILQFTLNLIITN